jgi:hypothetical protein
LERSWLNNPTDDKPHPHAELLKHVLDFKHFLEPNGMAPAANMKGIKYLAGFRLSLSESEELKLYYLKQRDGEWAGPVFPFVAPNTLQWPQYPALVIPGALQEFLGEGATEQARMQGTLVHTLQQLMNLGAMVQVHELPLFTCV